MAINSAQSQLLELAEAMRGEEWADDLAGALIAAANAGWEFTHAYREAFRLLLKDDGHPKEMRDACQAAARKTQAADPDAAARILAPYRTARGWGEPA